ncbi:MAG: response regulator [Nitrospiraceae bacterium]
MTILLADRDAYLRGRLRKRLEKVSGVTVVGESSNSIETTAMILNRNPDVAIVSSLLEGGSGLDVLRHVRQLMIPPMIIVVTDNPSLDNNNAYSIAGADFICEKVSDDRSVIGIIRLLCDRHRQTDVMDSSFATRQE